MWAFLGGLCALVVFLGFPALVWVIVYWDIKRQENRPLTEAERRQAIKMRYHRASQRQTLSPEDYREFLEARAAYAEMVERENPFNNAGKQRGAKVDGNQNGS